MLGCSPVGAVGHGAEKRPGSCPQLPNPASQPVLGRGRLKFNSEDSVDADGE